MNPRDDTPEVGTLGKKLGADPPPPPEEDWRPYKPGIEINGKGQLRTVIPLTPSSFPVVIDFCLVAGDAA